MKLPATVKIGHAVYALERWPAEFQPDEKFGQCDTEVGRIRIQDGHDGPRGAATVIHEIMHACFYEGGLRPGDDEERVVTVLSARLADVLVDNPKLLAWLTHHLRETT